MAEETGIIECTDKEHRALKYPSISELGLFRRAPILFKDKYIDGKLYEDAEPESASLKIGTALHLAVLEPKKFEQKVRSIPRGLKLNTKLGVDFKTKFIEPGEAEGEIYIKEEDMVHVLGAAKALYSEPQIASLLTRIVPETTFLFKPDSLTLCKARLDGFIDEADSEPTIIDLKSTRDVVRFEKSLTDYGYHRQAAFYMEAFRQVTGTTPRFYWIAVEVSPPYLYRLMSPSSEMIAKGRAEYLETLESFRYCVTNEVWPGTFKGLEEVPLPHWMKPEGEKITPWKTINTAKEEKADNGINQT